MLTGVHYGELRSAQVRDVQSGRCQRWRLSGRHALVLTEEAVQHFSVVTSGKAPDAPIFTRADGGRWGKSHQDRRLKDACLDAEIRPSINFYILRHTFATRALRPGAAMQYVSHQLGHKNIRTTQRHYAHVIPSDASEAIRRAMGNLGIVEMVKEAARAD